MGNQIRTPKEKYFDGGVVKFYVKEKQIYYKTIIWTKDGLKQFTFETGKYFGDSITDIHNVIDRALQKFTSVEVKN